MRALGKSPGPWIAMVLLAAAVGVQSAGGVSQAVTLRIGAAAVSPDTTVRVGQLVTWRIQFSNGGADTAAAAKLLFHTSGVHVSGIAAGSTVGACSGTSCSLGDLYPGESGTVTVSGTPTGVGRLDWDGTLSSSNSTVGVGRAGTVTVVGQRADLTLTGKPSSTSVKTGQPITYAFVVVGHGPDVAKTAKLTFHPTGPHLSNVKFTINGAAASCSGWRCPLGNLGPAGIAKVTLTATPTQIGTLLWDATAASAAADPTPADATRSGSVVVGSPHANLSVQLTPAPPAVAVVHGLLHFHVVVHNGGPETAVGAKLRWQALGIHLDELGIFPSSGGCSSSGACDLGSIAPGKDASVAVFGRPATTGAIEYTATASTATADPDPSNNRTTGTVTVNPAIADIGVTVTAPATGHVNTGLLFYFSPTNAGPTLAPRLKFTFHATGPHLTHLVWGPSYQQICVGNSTCLVGDLRVAPSGGLEFSAVPTQTGTLSWTIQVTSDATDPSPGNNIQSGQITITN